ncbi:hypothetical protein CPC08DRAFT_247340 [Agrocybe pediades]|nr:hypothetical protein CPC08DRAFT_247340 [Agrocybe pediades]
MDFAPSSDAMGIKRKSREDCLLYKLRNHNSTVPWGQISIRVVVIHYQAAYVMELLFEVVAIRHIHCVQITRCEPQKFPTHHRLFDYTFRHTGARSVYPRAREPNELGNHFPRQQDRLRGNANRCLPRLKRYYQTVEQDPVRCSQARAHSFAVCWWHHRNDPSVALRTAEDLCLHR